MRVIKMRSYTVFQYSSRISTESRLTGTFHDGNLKDLTCQLRIIKKKSNSFAKLRAHLAHQEKGACILRTQYRF